MLTSADHPTAEGVLGVVRDALTVVLETQPSMLTRDTALADIGADSLALVEVAEIVEEQLAPYASHPIAIPDSELEQLQTVGQLVDYLLARL